MKKYVIGEVINEYVKSTNTPFRIYAADRDMGEIEFSAIRNGRRTASVNKLKTLIDINLLHEPLQDELKSIVDELDTELLIDIYNVIYNKKRKK